MDHGIAVREKFTERYLLGELDATELAEFEEHYFECPLCAEDIIAGTRLAANLRVVLSEMTGVQRVEIGGSAKVLELTIRMKTPNWSSPLECELKFAITAVPLVVGAMPSAGTIHLSLPVDALPAGPCTIIIREKGSLEEIERHAFVLSKNT